MRARAGFALAETMAAAVLMSVILLAVARNAGSSQRASQLITMHNVLATEEVRALDALQRELSYGGISTCRAVPPDEQGLARVREGQSYDNFTWSPVQDVGISGPTYGPPVTLQLVPEVGEPIDGVDNDADGLVDERRLVRISGGQTSPLLSGVTALSFTLTGGLVTIDLRAGAGNGQGVVAKRMSVAAAMLND